MTYAFLALEFALVSALLLGTFHLRRQLGLSAVVAVVASLQFLQALLGQSLYWRFAGDYLLTPGSCVLFASNLAILLYAHSRSGPSASRKILYGVLLANISASLVSASIGLHIQYVEPVHFVDVPAEIFTQSLWIALIGVLSLYLSQLFAIILLEWLRARFTGLPKLVPLTMALVAALSFDSVFFLTLTFWGAENFQNLLMSSLISKSAGGLAFGIVWGLFLQRKATSEADEFGHVLQYLLFRDEIEELREAAVTDPLTGLYNRRKYNSYLSALVEADDGPACFALMLFDADNFKAVNDTLGHAEGDRLLASVSETIRKAIRDDDRAFRFGGDEFAIILEDCDRPNAEQVAARITEFEFDHPELQHSVTLSGGISIYPDDASDLEALFDVADRRLYQAKESDHDRFIAH
ncbi:MAG: GGDEF domain-containing protein [Myxococcota bacterium]